MKSFRRLVDVAITGFLQQKQLDTTKGVPFTHPPIFATPFQRLAPNLSAKRGGNGWKLHEKNWEKQLCTRTFSGSVMGPDSFVRKKNHRKCNLQNCKSTHEMLVSVTMTLQKPSKLDMFHIARSNLWSWLVELHPFIFKEWSILA